MVEVETLMWIHTFISNELSATCCSGRRAPPSQQLGMDVTGTRCVSEVHRTAVSLLYHPSVCASVLTQLLFSDTSGA